MITRPITTAAKPAPSLTLPFLILNVATTAGVGLFVYWLWLGAISKMPFDAYIATLTAGSIITGICLGVLGPGSFSRGLGLFQIFRHALGSITLAFTILFVALALTKRASEVSRAWLLIWAAGTGVSVVLVRLALIAGLRMLRNYGFNCKEVVIVGFGPVCRAMIDRVTSASWSGFHIGAIYDNRRRHGDSYNGIPILQGVDSLPEDIESGRIQEVWIALPVKAERLIQRIVDDVGETTATIRFIPDAFAMRLHQHRVSEIHGFPMFDLSASRIVGFNRMLKEAIDRVIAAIVLLLGGPVYLLIALLVKLSSPGPIFFRQQRHGWDGRLVTIYKFRTMRVHETPKDRPDQVGREDPRVTGIGNFLRRTSLDEIPQFINVLQGRMSIVGPRPHPIELNDAFRSRIRQYMRRHKVKPGITGLAQVSGWRGETDSLQKMRKRVQYDLYYIENWSLGMDARIMGLTLLKGFVHPNAF